MENGTVLCASCFHPVCKFQFPMIPLVPVWIIRWVPVLKSDARFLFHSFILWYNFDLKSSHFVDITAWSLRCLGRPWRSGRSWWVEVRWSSFQPFLHFVSIDSHEYFKLASQFVKIVLSLWGFPNQSAFFALQSLQAINADPHSTYKNTRPEARLALSKMMNSSCLSFNTS